MVGKAKNNKFFGHLCKKFTDPWDKERLGSSVGIFKGDGLWIWTT